MKRTLTVCLCIASCRSSEEAPSVELAVVASSGGITATTNDLGYAVTVTSARAAVRDIELTIEGETHESVSWPADVASDPPPLRHPGHSAGGAVTGELPGDFIVDWLDDGSALGTATLLVGEYQGANFAFRRAGASDALAAGDPLLSHTFHLAGTAEKDGQQYEFEAVIDIDEDTPMVGMPFACGVAEDTGVTLGLELLLADPVEADTLLDTVDFSALADGAGTVSIEPGQDVHNILKRQVQLHDHYQMVVR